MRRAIAAFDQPIHRRSNVNLSLQSLPFRGTSRARKSGDRSPHSKSLRRFFLGLGLIENPVTLRDKALNSLVGSLDRWLAEKKGVTVTTCKRDSFGRILGVVKDETGTTLAQALKDAGIAKP